MQGGKLGEPAWLQHLLPNLQQHLGRGATEAYENKIMAKGEAESEKSKQALETIFSLNKFTSLRANKT